MPVDCCQGAVDVHHTALLDQIWQRQNSTTQHYFLLHSLCGICSTELPGTEEVLIWILIRNFITPFMSFCVWKYAAFEIMTYFNSETYIFYYF
jgi:hypothetical protein